MADIKKSCATCRWFLYRCNAECEECENGIERGDGTSACKCLGCYIGTTDTYRYHVPNETLTRYFKGD